MKGAGDMSGGAAASQSRSVESGRLPGRLSRRWLGSRDGFVVIALLAIAVAYGLVMAQMPLFEPDEGRYAEIPREMLESGDFITPHLEGVEYLEKPPLYFWLNALSLKVLGRSQIAVRVWSLFFGVLGAGLVMLLGRHMFGQREGRRAALVLLTAPFYFALMGINIIDMTMTFFLSLTLGFFWFAHESERQRNGLWFGAFVAAALTVMTKGLVGLVLPAGVAFVYLAVSRQLGVLKRVPWVRGLLLFLLVAVPWHVLIARQTPGFVSFYFVHEHFLRYLTDTHQRTQPFWYFVPVLALGMLPWIGYLPRALMEMKHPLSPDKNREQRSLLFLVVWCCVIVGFFSLSGSKLPPYVLPATLPLALLIARGTTLSRFDAGASAKASEDTTSSETGFSLVASHSAFILVAVFLLLASIGLIELDIKAKVTPAVGTLAVVAILLVSWNLVAISRSESGLHLHRLALAGGCLCFAILFAANQVAEYRTSKRVASCIDSFPYDSGRGPSQVFAFESIPQSLPYYLDRMIGIVGFRGEIEYGVARLEDAERLERFPSAVEFLPRWETEQQFYLVVEHKSLDKASASGLTGRLVCDGVRYDVFTNRPSSARSALR